MNDGMEFGLTALVFIAGISLLWLMAWCVAKDRTPRTSREEPPEVAKLPWSIPPDTQIPEFTLHDPYTKETVTVRIKPYATSFDVEFDRSTDGFAFIVERGSVDVFKLMHDTDPVGPVSCVVLNKPKESACPES